MDIQHLDTNVINVLTRHTFQTDYSMKGSEAGMHEKIVAMAVNDSGCREKSTVNIIKNASICYFMTDAWSVCSNILSAEKYIIGKLWTQRIERNNLNLSTQMK